MADIKCAADAALLHRILAGADVFIQNLAPGAARRAGFGSAELRARYPRLITLDISGYGEDGAYAGMKAYDLLVQAESGLASITGHPAGAGRVGVSACDIACGLTAYSGVLEALIARGISGQGQALSVSLFDAIVDWMTVPLLQAESTGMQPPRLGLAHPTICPYGAFDLSGGGQILIAIQNEREWADFCTHVLEQQDLPQDPRSAGNEARVANRAFVDELVARVLGSLTAAQAQARLTQANTAFGFVRDMAGLAAHPALRRVDAATPNGPVSIVAPPVRRGRAASAGAVPALGAHSAALRAEFAS